MNKVSLPKEVAEALEWAIKVHSTKFNVIDDVLNYDGDCDFIGLLNDFFVQGDKHDEFISALVNGYEIEQTPEEKVREYYEGLDEDIERREAVRETLDLLGIKIEGINTRDKVTGRRPKPF